MNLIVGLGNPGSKYKNTRHNVGFQVLDQLSKKWDKSKTSGALYFWTMIGDESVELLKPQEYMNKSGRTVAIAMKKHRLDPNEIIVIHDDTSLSLGSIKISQGRGDAGHNGVKSIIDSINSNEFTRLRIGVGRGPEELKKFVLKRMNIRERSEIKKGIKKAIDALDTIVIEGVESAMNQFN